MDNDCIQLINFDTPILDDGTISIEIRKAIQVVDLYTEEKNQDWLWFRWIIWEEICRLMPIKTTQPTWPFGNLVYYKKRFSFGILDVWVAHYWHRLNGGILFLKSSYLEPFEYKRQPKKKNVDDLKKGTSITKIKRIQKIREKKKKIRDRDKKKFVPNPEIKSLGEKFRKENRVHSEKFTEAKHNYLLIEEKKYNVKKTTNLSARRKTKRNKIKIEDILG
jgi:hypothetical protein